MLPIDTLQKDIYNHLKENNHVTCDYDTFKETISVYQSPGGVYCDLFENINPDMQTDMINKILNVTPEKLAPSEQFAYKNVMDWLIQQHEMVRYIQKFNAYILISKDNITFYD